MENPGNRISVAPPHESLPSPVAIVYRSEFDYISRCILDYRNIETGGQLFGFWTSTGIPVVLYAIGPGRNANHQETFFNQDLEYLVNVGNFLLEKYGLQHIGEWHSHHQLGLAHPSGHDTSTMVHNIQNSHLRRFLLCIGNCNDRASTLNAFNFHEDHGYDYVQARWSIKECKSPFRALVDWDLRDVLIHPETVAACHGEVFEIGCQTTLVREYEAGYWLNDPENRKNLAKIVAFMKEAGKVPRVTLDGDRHVHIFADCMELYFSRDFPKEPCEIKMDGVTAGDKSLWNFQGDVLEAFTQYFDAVARLQKNENKEA